MSRSLRRGSSKLPFGPCVRGGSLHRLLSALAIRPDYGHGTSRAPTVGSRGRQAEQTQHGELRLKTKGRYDNLGNECRV